jgi:hypothetical protein
LVATYLQKHFLEQFSRIVFLLEAKVAVPYIPAFRSLLALFVISISTGSSKFHPLCCNKGDLTRKVLSGYTLATTLVSTFNPAT